MNKGYKRIKVDVTDTPGAVRDAADLDVTLTVVDPCGPGGGNPVVALYGPKDNVNRLLASWGYNEKGEA